MIRIPPLGRPALFIVLAGLVLVVAALSYVAYQRTQAPMFPPDAPAQSPRGYSPEKAFQQLRLMMALLLFSVLAIIVFVVGSYLAIRFGRMLVTKDIGGKPTRYVDAWGSYRITPEQIDAATEESRTDSPSENRPPDSIPPPDAPDESGNDPTGDDRNPPG